MQTLKLFSSMFNFYHVSVYSKSPPTVLELEGWNFADMFSDILSWNPRITFLKFCLEPFLWNNLCPKNALKLRKLNFEISNSYKNGSRPNFKKVILQFQDNISENISTKFQPSSSKTVGGDRFWINGNMVKIEHWEKQL